MGIKDDAFKLANEVSDLARNNDINIESLRQIYKVCNIEDISAYEKIVRIKSIVEVTL